nr:retrotransposon protein [Tanacetum cinerariifolium]
MIIKKDSKIVKVKVERKSLALKAKKESSDEECLTFESETKKVVMTRTVKVIENALDAATQIILLENVQNHRKTRIKELLSEICLGVDLEPDEWIKDNGCSKHMTGNQKLFSSYKAYNGGNVIFGSNLRGQIRDNECRVTFSKHDSEITKDGKVIGHANMRLIQSLACKELVRNLPKLKFDQHFCDACKIEKQAHVSHKAKNIVSTTRCLELLHMDLFGPSAVWSHGENRYTLVIVDNYSRYTWTRLLKDKTEAFDQFEILKDGVTRLKKYSELSAAEAIQADCDVKATNIILQALPPEIYALVSTHKVTKDLWERIQMLKQGTSLTKQERECKLYDAFDKFVYQKGETLRDFYLRFSLLLNDMNMYNMKLEQFQVNTKFLNTLPPE